jgi:hypothetical protein
MLCIQINTRAFPDWSGYHPETESRLNMGRGHDEHVILKFIKILSSNKGICV